MKTYNQTETSLQNQILDILARCGKVSVSELKSMLNDKGWARLGNNADAETLFEHLGFTLVHTYKKGTTRVVSTHVTL